MKSRSAWRVARGCGRLSSGTLRLLADGVVIAGPLAAWLAAGLVGAILIGAAWWIGPLLVLVVGTLALAHDGDRLSVSTLLGSLRLAAEAARGRARARMVRREWPRVCERAGWVTPGELDKKRPVPALRFARRVGRRLVVAWRPVESVAPQDYPRHVEALRRTLGAHAADWRPVAADPGTVVAMFGMDPLPDLVADRSGDARFFETRAETPSRPSLAECTYPQPEISGPDPARETASEQGNPGRSGGVSGHPVFGFQLGPDSGGGEMVWRPSEAPHLLVCGTTGSGKGSVLRTLVSQAMDAGWLVDVIDGKQGGEYRWADDAGADVTATGVEMAVDRLGDLEMDTNDTGRLLWQHGVESWRDLPTGCATDPRLLVVDEAADLMMLRRVPEEKDADRHRAAFASRLTRIVSQGRAVGIHVVIALQRPDAQLLGPSGGFLRSNLAGRVAVGSLDGDGADMLFGPGGRDAAAAYLDGTPGRGLAAGLTRGQIAPSPFQTYYVRAVDLRGEGAA